jgi:hypothetical protein
VLESLKVLLVSKKLCQTKGGMFGKKSQMHFFDFFTLKMAKNTFDLRTLFLKHNFKYALSQK